MLGEGDDRKYLTVNDRKIVGLSNICYTDCK